MQILLRKLHGKVLAGSYVTTSPSVEDELIVYGCRLLIPLQMHREMLKQLHKAHHGAVRTKQRARLTIYWPGIDSEIDNMVLQCTQCQTHLPSHQKELMISKPRPTRPFQEIAADFCQHAGKYYLVFVDCFTDWPTIVPLGTSTTATDLITASRELFSRTAVPDVFWSDGGPQFTSNSSSPQNGDLVTGYPPPIIHRVMGRRKLQSNP